MIKEIEDIFNRGIFVQCITCGSTLCIVGYRMLLVRGPGPDKLHTPQIVKKSTSTCFGNHQTELFSNDFIASVLLLTAFLGEIFYYCHYGNQIKVKADELCNAVYASRWYVVVCRCAGPGGRHPHQRALMSSISIIMERIKRPTHVTAGNLVKLTYETFIAVRVQLSMDGGCIVSAKSHGLLSADLQGWLPGVCRSARHAVEMNTQGSIIGF